MLSACIATRSRRMRATGWWTVSTNVAPGQRSRTSGTAAAPLQSP